MTVIEFLNFCGPFFFDILMYKLWTKPHPRKLYEENIFEDLIYDDVEIRWSKSCPEVGEPSGENFLNGYQI